MKKIRCATRTGKNRQLERTMMIEQFEMNKHVEHRVNRMNQDNMFVVIHANFYQNPTNMQC